VCALRSSVTDSAVIEPETVFDLGRAVQLGEGDLAGDTLDLRLLVQVGDDQRAGDHRDVDQAVRRDLDRDVGLDLAAAG